VSTTPPQRYKDRADFSVDEELAAVQEDRRGEPPPKFETAEYRQARREHLQAGGFDPGDDDAQEPKPPEEMSADEHFEQMRKGA
jgi:hypothetical protein